ncbi:unnamed protein product, partial [Ostreobium quekettii]
MVEGDVGNGAPVRAVAFVIWDLDGTILDTGGVAGTWLGLHLPIGLGEEKGGGFELASWRRGGDERSTCHVYR